MVDFIPKVRYRGRPALLIVLGALSGILLSHSGISVPWMLLPIVLGILVQQAKNFYLRCWSPPPLLFPFDTPSPYATKEEVAIPFERVTLVLCTIPLFFFYAKVRDLPRQELRTARTFYQQQLDILYPIRQQLEEATIFLAEMPTPTGYRYTIRLRIPDGVVLPSEYHYASSLKATFDLTPIRNGREVDRSSGFRNYLLSEGFEAEGVLQSIEHIEKSAHVPLRVQMRQVRAKLLHAFEAKSSTYIEQRDRGLLYALCLGERGYLPKDVKQSFTYAGVAHLLAVSGYHLGVVFGILGGILLWLLPGWRYMRIRALILLLGLLAYTFLSGASTATLRAMVMSGILLSSRILRRPTDSIQLLSLTLLFFLLINPYAYRSVGLLLSLGAVWGIYLFTTPLFTFINPQHPLLRYLLQLLLVTFSVQLTILPLLCYFFDGLPLSFLWSNLPLILLSSLLIPVGLIVLLLTPLIPLPAIIYLLLGQLTAFVREVVQAFSPIGQDLTLKINFDLPLCVLYYTALLLLYQLLYTRANSLHGSRL